MKKKKATPANPLVIPEKSSPSPSNPAVEKAVPEVNLNAPLKYNLEEPLESTTKTESTNKKLFLIGVVATGVIIVATITLFLLVTYLSSPSSNFPPEKILEQISKFIDKETNPK